MLVKGQSTHRLLMFLHGVVVDGACDLDGLRLRKPEYVESLAAFRWRMGPGPNAEILSAGAVLDGVECVAFGTPSVLADRASAALTALRIWTRRPIASLATFQAERRNVFRGSMLPASRVSWFGRGEPLADVAGFVNFWRRTREVLFRPPDALGVALRRVDLMVEQERQADRVLDLCIILEARFQRGDEKQELAYRLRLRTAHFVGTSKQSRQEIFETVREGYALRSKIAHGDGVSGSDATTQKKLEEVVFAVLKLYCERAAAFPNQTAHKAIIHELDGYLLERRTDV